MSSTSNKTVLITGASRGIGLALATHYQTAGWNVIGAVRTPATADKLQELKPFKIVQLETTDEDSIRRAAKELEGVAVDVMINNAGICLDEDFDSIKKESLMRQFEVNAVGSFLVTRGLLPCLKNAVSASGSAKLVHISSMLGSVGLFDPAAMYLGYRASKSGLNMLNAGIAHKLKDEKITSVVMCPGYVATDLNNYAGFLKPADSAARIFKVINGLTFEDTGKYFNNEGANLPCAAVLGLASAADPWGYNDNRADQLGPSGWGEVNPACSGSHQSPVNLEYEGEHIEKRWGEFHEYPPIEFRGDCRKFNLKKLEDLFKWELGANEDCQLFDHVSNKTYALLQFHAHNPSEHTIYDHHYSGEIHFVHKEVGGSSLLVTGLLLSAKPEVAENSWIEDVWHTIHEGEEGKAVPVDLELNYVDFLTANVHTSHLFNYHGSLTTPPCSEIVTWWIINNPLHISESEFQSLHQAYKELPATLEGRDNRPTQPLNDRKVQYF
ncbi:hypothetical protein Poli38472_008115 [Pythium oligandrum]|uniref:carbonic anhydrase n=1 Tax=Pythium oligandrum TaxID=41045 RepID=A0A8K1FPC4_PYTOL|nr:hypothetical protein Poli38472_008115 [Pythium oligandrum]|eukprot:TMW65473.1 hypothetical protein Poli38472_008115 [Pythium oligandrum]